MKAAAESLENLPIFKNDEDREAFEACLDVDLSSQVCLLFDLRQFVGVSQFCLDYVFKKKRRHFLVILDN